MKIVLPLEIHTTKSKTKKGKFILNLNNYRNCHFQKLNKAKKAYADYIKELVADYDIEKQTKRLALEYYYYAKTKRKIDVSNPCSIIDKFTCDALTEVGLWDDDNNERIATVKYIFAGVDKENSRCELFINEHIY